MTRIFPSLAIMAALFLFAAQPASAGTIHTVVPAKIDPNATYLIYIHGARPESFPLSEPHPQRGPFEYQKILEAFATSGLEVIAELRTEKTNPRRFARTRVLKQVKALRAAGVPAHRITVAGFSKGGLISLIVAAQAREPKLNIVNMAGCGKGQFRRAYDAFLASDASKLQGRMLSIHDAQDRISGTCQEAKAKAPQLVFTEEVLTVGAGQGTFYTPRAIWVARVAAWAKSGTE